MTKTLTKEDMEFEERVRQGIQCPECYGVRVLDRIETQNNVTRGSWLCEECGCQWNRTRYVLRVEWTGR